MARGTMKWFNSQKGYGFIQPQGGGKDVFVHISAVEKAGLTNLNEGQSIEYEEVSNRGKTLAENLKVQRNGRGPIGRIDISLASDSLSGAGSPGAWRASILSPTCPAR
jgi:cold shock protein